MVIGLILGVAAGIAGTLSFQKYVLGLFKKVQQAATDVQKDLK